MTEPVELSGNQCLEQLERHGVGRVAFGTPLGPRIVLVEYTFAGGEIVFRTTPFSEVGTYAPGTEVAFEVDDADATGRCGCSVVALGRAEVVEPPAWAGHPGPDDAGAASHEERRWIKVSAHDFTGIRVAAQVDHT
jgi:uncharacterized protein